MQNYGCSSEIPEDERQVIWEQQRKERGFDDTETWCLRSAFSKFIVPRLQAFKEQHICHPCSMTMEEWDNIIQEMIDGFKEVEKIDEFSADIEKINRALELFSKWYLDLWW